MDLTPEQKAYVEEAMNVFGPPIAKFYREMQILMVEHKGLLDLSKAMGDENDKNKTAEFEELFFKYADIAARYRAVMQDVMRAVKEKHRRLVENQDRLAKAFADIGLEAPPESLLRDDDWPEFLNED